MEKFDESTFHCRLAECEDRAHPGIDCRTGRDAGPAARSTRMAATPKPAPSPRTGIAYPAAWWEGPGRRSAPKSRRSRPVVCGARPKPVTCRDMAHRSTVSCSISSSLPAPAKRLSPSPISRSPATTRSLSRTGGLLPSPSKPGSRSICQPTIPRTQTDWPNWD
jgi:hypothetical protein